MSENFNNRYQNIYNGTMQTQGVWKRYLCGMPYNFKYKN